MFWFKKMVNNVRARGGIQSFYDPTNQDDVINFLENDKDFRIADPLNKPKAIGVSGGEFGVIHTVNNSPKKPNTERFYELMKEAEIFITSVAEDDVEVVPTETEENFDLPFRTVTFEHAGYSPPVVFIDIRRFLIIPCILVHETAPRQYQIYAWVAEHSITPDLEVSPETLDFLLSGSTVIKLSKNHPYHDSIITLLKQYITRLSRYKIGEERVKEHVKIGSGHRKESFTIRRVLHIAPKRLQGNTAHWGTRKVEWSHRWTVRGTWVRLTDENGNIDYNRLGKDRDGNRVIPGCTWRVDHVKGPEDKPIIKKLRVIDNE